MNNLSIGKRRGLQQCSTIRKTFAILALDHRNNLRNALNPNAPEMVSDRDLIDFKVELIRTVSSMGSSVLLDPQFSASQCIASDALSGKTGIICAVEETGYDGESVARISRVLSNWSVEKIRRMGASAVKLLVYYHPKAPTAQKIEDFVKQIAEDCATFDIPLFLEPLSYSLKIGQKKVVGQEREDIVLETARRLVNPGVDVLKAEFPLDIQTFTEEDNWKRACKALSETISIPWVLLSASVTYEVFIKQVLSACLGGASGVAVGRAVWQEASVLSGMDRHNFLTEIAAERMSQTTNLINAIAKPWSDFYDTEIPDSQWYKNY
ncbi:MAG: tagatose 1,6-diphosphate aldolase [Flexilinea sp.]